MNFEISVAQSMNEHSSYNLRYFPNEYGELWKTPHQKVAGKGIFKQAFIAVHCIEIISNLNCIWQQEIALYL